GDVDDAARGLRRAGGRSDLEEGELDEALVDLVAGAAEDLDAVPRREGPPPADGAPAGDGGGGVAEREGEARRDEAEEGRDRAELGDPDAPYEEHPERDDGVAGRLAPLVLRADVLRAVVDDPDQERARDPEHDDHGERG